jgi:hypothetical protein
MFIWRRISSIRSRAFLMVGVTLLSFLSIFTPMFTGTASAVTAEDVLNRARAWSILNAVIDHRDSMRKNIPSGDIDQCNLFNNNAAVYVGATVTGNPDVGEQSWENIADNSSILNGALASVGIDRGCRGLLEAIGYTSNGAGLSKPDDFGDKLSARIRSALDPNAFFGANIGDNGPGQAITYAILYYNLTKVCGWSFRNSYTDNSNPDYKTRNDEAKVNGWNGINRGRHYHTYTYEQGKAGDNTYFKGGGREDEVRVGSKSGAGSGTSGNNDALIDCGDNTGDTFGAILAPDHNPRFADAYAKLLKPGGDSTPGTCLDRYEGDEERLKACDEGFNNKNNPTYCRDKYPIIPIQDTNAGLREACEYGRQTATGDSSATTPPPGTEGGDGEAKNTCRVEGIGWIICPVFKFLAKITDQTYGVVANFMKVQPLNANGDSGIYNAWSVMRNFANVAFVIAFLVIVFSQLTSAGISNYGIKKMLPRLVVGAILVNVSYWICAVAVDISNILGTSLYGLLTNMQGNVGISAPEGSFWSTGGGGWDYVVGGALGLVALGAAFYVTLAVLLPMLVAVLATILTVFFALILRQALIIILIVISPLAFVAYLLPNTASLFQKWRSFLQILLLMFPIIALLFGGAALASTVIMASSEDWYIQIAGAGAAVLPLAAAPTLINGFNRFAGRFGLPQVGFKLDRTKKAAKGLGEELEQKRGAAALTGGNAIGAGGRHRRAFRRQMRRQANETKLKSAQAQFGVTDDKTAGYVATQTQAQAQINAINAANNTRFVGSVANNPNLVGAGMGDAANDPEVQRALAAQQQKAVAEAIKDAQLSANIEPGNLEEMGRRLATAVQSGDSITARAMQNMLLTSGSKGLSEYRKTMTKLGDNDPTSMDGEAVTRLRENLLQNHAGVKASAADLTAHAAAGGTMRDASNRSTTWDMSDNELVKQKPASIKFAVRSGAVSQKRATDIMGNSELFDHLSPEIKTMLEDWATSPPGTRPEDLPQVQGIDDY